jgi:hypothetical protein
MRVPESRHWIAPQYLTHFARSALPRELASFDNELAAVFGLRRMGETIIEQDANAHAASQVCVPKISFCNIGDEGRPAEAVT